MNAPSLHKRAWPRFVTRAVGALLAFPAVTCLAQTPAPSDVTSPPPDPESLTSRLSNAENRAQASQQVYAGLRRVLVGLEQPTFASLKSASDTNRELKQRLDDALASRIAAVKTSGASLDDLRNQLTDIEKQRDDAAAALTTGTAPGGPGAPKDQKPVDSNEAPTYIRLFRNHVIPVEEPYFSFTNTVLVLRTTGQRFNGVVITRVRRGDPFEDAVRPGGLLERFLKGKDPASTYVYLQVCSDSIPAYYAVADAVGRQGFSCAWVCGSDDTLYKAPIRDENKIYVNPGGSSQ